MKNSIFPLHSMKRFRPLKTAVKDMEGATCLYFSKDVKYYKASSILCSRADSCFKTYIIKHIIFWHLFFLVLYCISGISLSEG